MPMTAEVIRSKSAGDVKRDFDTWLAGREIHVLNVSYAIAEKGAREVLVLWDDQPPRVQLDTAVKEWISQQIGV